MKERDIVAKLLKKMTWNIYTAFSDYAYKCDNETIKRIRDSNALAISINAKFDNTSGWTYESRIHLKSEDDEDEEKANITDDSED